MKQPIDFFKELTKIPRCSHHEEKVIEHLVSFAKERNLKHYVDAKGNLLIYKDGQGEPVILQGHVDMVCVKDVQSKFCFDTMPLEIVEEQGWIFAKETSLGADNGAAVAMIMALLDDQEAKLPPLEALFTVEEEVGLLGAAAVEKKAFKGKTLINLDSEEEGIFTLSCAGGVRNDLMIPITRVENNYKYAYKLLIGGLKGGHSGMEITKQRGNAIKILPRVLQVFENCSLTDLQGGSADNAICAYVSCTLVSDEDPVEKLQILEKDLQRELTDSDPKFHLQLEKTTAPEKVLSYQDVQNLKNILYALPNGIVKFSDMKNQEPQTSTNPGMIVLKENHIHVTSSHRSSSESQKKVLIETFDALAELCQGKAVTFGDYPGWEYAPISPIRDLFVQVFEKKYGRKPVLQGIHAGLECGVIAKRIGELDMISLGPDIEHVHSPAERMSLDSLQRTYELVKEVLENLRR